jgi:hypothetical protein
MKRVICAASVTAVIGLFVIGCDRMATKSTSENAQYGDASAHAMPASAMADAGVAPLAAKATADGGVAPLAAKANVAPGWPGAPITMDQ